MATNVGQPKSSAVRPFPIGSKWGIGGEKRIMLNQILRDGEHPKAFRKADLATQPEASIGSSFGM